MLRRINKQRGAIAPDLAADIVAATANPLDDMEATRIALPKSLRLPCGFIVGLFHLRLSRSTNGVREDREREPPSVELHFLERTIRVSHHGPIHHLHTDM